MFLLAWNDSTNAIPKGQSQRDSGKPRFTREDCCVIRQEMPTAFCVGNRCFFTMKCRTSPAFVRSYTAHCPAREIHAWLSPLTFKSAASAKKNLIFVLLDLSSPERPLSPPTLLPDYLISPSDAASGRPAHPQNRPRSRSVFGARRVCRFASPSTKTGINKVIRSGDRRMSPATKVPKCQNKVFSKTSIFGCDSKTGVFGVENDATQEGGVGRESIEGTTSRASVPFLAFIRLSAADFEGCRKAGPSRNAVTEKSGGIQSTYGGTNGTVFSGEPQLLKNASRSKV